MIPRNVLLNDPNEWDKIYSIYEGPLNYQDKKMLFIDLFNEDYGVIKLIKKWSKDKWNFVDAIKYYYNLKDDIDDQLSRLEGSLDDYKREMSDIEDEINDLNNDKEKLSYSFSDYMNEFNRIANTVYNTDVENFSKYQYLNLKYDKEELDDENEDEEISDLEDLKSELEDIKDEWYDKDNKVDGFQVNFNDLEIEANEIEDLIKKLEGYRWM